MDRTAHGARQERRLLSVVTIETPSETAAEQRPVDENFLRRKLQCSSDFILDELLALDRSPDIATIVGGMRGAIHRLHGGVRHELRLIIGCHLLAARGWLAGQLHASP